MNQRIEELAERCVAGVCFRYITKEERRSIEYFSNQLLLDVKFLIEVQREESIEKDMKIDESFAELLEKINNKFSEE